MIDMLCKLSSFRINGLNFFLFYEKDVKRSGFSHF